MSKSEEDFQASIRVLEGTLGMYQGGLKESYRIVATELRKLLCDRDPLLIRVRPDFRLHKLHWTEVLERTPSLAEGLEIMLPGQLAVSSDGTYSFKLSFARSLTLMEPNQWVKQPFLSPQITVRELVKSVADKEGAHSDPDYNETLVRAKLVRYVKDESHIPSIIGIAEYLLSWLEESQSRDASTQL